MIKYLALTIILSNSVFFNAQIENTQFSYKTIDYDLNNYFRPTFDSTSFFIELLNSIKQNEIKIYFKEFDAGFKENEVQVFDYEIENCDCYNCNNSHLNIKFKIGFKFPLVNSHNNDSTIFNDDGNMMFVYPEPFNLNFKLSDFNKMVIKYIIDYDTKTDTNILNPFALGYLNHTKGMEDYEIFWISFSDLSSSLKFKNDLMKILNL